MSVWKDFTELTPCPECGEKGLELMWRSPETHYMCTHCGAKVSLVILTRDRSSDERQSMEKKPAPPEGASG